MHKTKFTKPLKNLTCVSAVGRQTANSRPTVGHLSADCTYTCQIFKCQFAVGQVSVNCWYTAGRQYTDSRPTDF